MTGVLLWVLAIQALVIMGWAMGRRDRMIQFPFLAAAVFLGWILPQLMGVRSQPFLPAGGVEKTILMAILCLGAAWWGYEMNRRPAKLFDWDFNYGRLLAAAALMMVLGAFFSYQISVIGAEVTAATGGQWTGVITIYVFFAKLLTFGMALAVILYLRKPNPYALVLVLFGLMFYMERILIRGRRAAMIELGMMIFLALWFNRRALPPRWLMLSAIFAGALLVNSIGDFRNTMMGDERFTWSGAGISDVLAIDYFGNLQRIASGEAGTHNVLNAVMNISAADRTLRFDYGLSHWNGFVHQYVPGQWVGYDVKESMMLDFTDQAGQIFGHRPHTGSTHTGLSDAFLSFWYFGAVKFLLIGLIVSRWYRAAVQGQIVGQLVVILTISPALHAITHSTHSFFTTFLQLAVFLIPALLFARRPTRREVAMQPIGLYQPRGFGFPRQSDSRDR